jgi:hypothetical protein
MYIMKAHYLTLSSSARLAREITADPSRVHCQSPWSCWLPWHCRPSRTADRLLRALLRISTPPMSLQHHCFLSITHAPPCQDQIVSKSTYTCLSSSRNAVAAIILSTFSRGKPSRQYEHDCDCSVQLPPSPTVSRTALPSQSRSST